MNQKHKPYYYIDAYIDVSSYIPKTIQTDFEYIFYLNYDNSLQYLSESNTEHVNFYRIPNKTATITDVVTSTNPSINQYNYSSNVYFSNIQVVLTNTFYPYNQPPQLSEVNSSQSCLFGGEFSPSQFAIDPNGKYLYSGSRAPFVSVHFRYDLTSFDKKDVDTLLGTGDTVVGVAITPDGSWLITSGIFAGAFRYIDLTNFTEYFAIGFDDLYLSAFYAISNDYYVYGWAYYYNRMIKINFYTGIIVADFPIAGDYCTGLKITSNQQYLIVVVAQGLIHKIDLSSFSVTASIDITQLIDTLELSTDGQFAYVASREDGTATNSMISRINIDTFTVVETFVLSSITNAIVHHLTDDILFVGTYESPANVLTLTTSPTMNIAKSVALSTANFQTYLYNGIADPIRPYIYFGACNSANPTSSWLIRYNYITFENDILISGLSNELPGNLENNIIQTDVDFKTQVTKRVDNTIPNNNCYIALYVKGNTGGQLNDQPQTIHVRLKVFPYA